MKSLPEKDFWKAIRLRLENYSEEAPDDDWDKIAAAIPSTKKPGSEKLSVAADLLAVIMLFAIVFMTPVTENTKGAEHAKVPPPESKEKAAPSDRSRSIVMKPQTADEQHVPSPSGQHHARKQKDFITMPGVLPLPLAEVGAGTKKQIQRKKTSHPSEEILINQETTPAVAILELTRSTGILGEGYTPDYNIAMGSLQPDSVIASVPADSGIVYYSVPPILERRKPRRKFKPSVYAMATPSLAYQKVVPVRHDAINIQELNGGSIFAGNRFGFGLDVGFQMQVSSRLELYASISYYTQRQSILYSYTSGDQMSVAESKDIWSYTLTPEATTQQLNYKMQNAGAAAGVLYHLYGRALMHKIGAGLQYQQGLMRMASEGSYNNAASSYLNYQLLYRMEFVMRARTHFFLQPVFTHVITSREQLKEPFEIRPYRAGIGFGLVYHF